MRPAEQPDAYPPPPPPAALATAAPRLSSEQILDNARVFLLALWGGIPSTAPTFSILWLWMGRETAINCTWPIELTQCERVNECESGAHESGHWEAGDGVGFELAGVVAWKGKSVASGVGGDASRERDVVSGHLR